MVYIPPPSQVGSESQLLYHKFKGDPRHLPSHNPHPTNEQVHKPTISSFTVQSCIVHKRNLMVVFLFEVPMMHSYKCQKIKD
jgi:hypothetical protein